MDVNASWFSLYLAKKLNFRCSSMYAFELSISCKCLGFRIMAEASKKLHLNCFMLIAIPAKYGQKIHVLITYVKDILRVVLTGLIKYSLRDDSILLFYPS